MISSLSSISGLHPYDTASVFAGDMMRRAGATKPVPGVRAVAPEATPFVETEAAAQTGQGTSASLAQAEEAAKKSAQSRRLESALAGVVTHMSDKFGATAGTAMMGLMYKRVGDGPVTEQSLGQGFLDVIRFVDKNFGIQEGDGLISYLNGDLNDSLNAFFENGSNEKFLATTTALPEGLSSSIQINLPKADVSEGAGPADAITTLLESYQIARGKNGVKKPRKMPGFAGAPYEDLTGFTPAPGVMVDAAA